MARKKSPWVIIRSDLALFMYRYFTQVSATGPASEVVFQLLRTDLKRGLDEAGVDITPLPPRVS